MKTTLLMAAGHDASVVSRTSMMTQGITLRWILLTTLLYLWPLLTAGRAETFEDFIYSTNGASATVVRYTGTNQNVTIPDYIAKVPVETIADSAFAGCTNLFYVTVPYTVTNLGNAVFEGCYTLVTTFFQGNAPTVPGSEDVFNGATNVTVYHWSGAEGWGSTFCGQPARIGTDTMSALFLFQQHGPTLTVTGYVGPGGDILVPDCCGDTFVTIIGDAAFSGCTNLTNVVIMQGITIIGNRAFEGCINLTNVVMMQGLNMIGDLAFEGCSNLAGVYFEGDAPTISDTGDLFEGAGQVTVFYRSGTKGWGTTFGGRPTAVWVDPSAPDFQYEQTAYTMSIAGYTGADSSITIPGQIHHCNVVSIGDSAFEGYSNLTSVVVPQGVTTIGNATFSECTKLANIVLPSSMVSMGNEAFQDCSSLTYIAIPGGVTTIGEAAFAHCTGLGYIEIPHSVTNIGKSVFAGCSSLRAITLGNGITAIPDYAFQGCSGLESIVIPGGVTHFGQEVFLECQSLTNVIMGNGIGSIWNSAFAGCSNLASISIPPSVTNIEESAFADCPKLASVTIPEGVSNLASRAFAECTGDLTPEKWTWQEESSAVKKESRTDEKEPIQRRTDHQRVA